MSTAIFSIFPFFLFFFPFTTISASSPSYLLSLSFPSFLFHGIRRRGSKLKRTIASKRVFVRHSNSSANIYIYIIYSIYTSFSLSLGGHSTKVRHCHATTLFESSRARTGEKAKKEELVRLSVCLVIIVGSESWWILVPRVLFVYPYTMRHGKYFDETIFFSFYTAIGILLLRGGIYIYIYTRFRNRWHAMMKVYFVVAYYLSSTYWIVENDSRRTGKYFKIALDAVRSDFRR